MKCSDEQRRQEPVSKVKIRLAVFYPVPSLNALFAMTHWSRHAEKKRTRRAFESALRVSGKDYWTQIISQGDANTSSTVAVIQDLSQTTGPTKSFLKAVRKKLRPPHKSTPK